MVVDSSIWLEIFFSGPLAKKCEREIGGFSLVIPCVVVFEVYKKIKLKIDQTKALEMMGVLSRHKVSSLDREISLLAADLSIEFDLAMADSIVLAHARYLNTKLLTLDNDFAAIPDAIVLR